MTGCSNGFLFYDNFLTNGAVLTFGKTGFFALGSNGGVNNLGVTGCSNGFLLYNNFLTNGAVLTFGKTGCFTLRSNGGVNNLGVTGCSNGFLLYNNFLTNGAVLTFGKTGFFTLRSNSGVNNLGVTGCSNGFLCNDNFFTNGAMLTFGKTGCFALRSNCCINDLGVRSQPNFFLFYENLFTNRALGSIGETGFGAGSSLAGNGYFGVAEGRCKCFSTYGASLIVLTSCLVGSVFVVAFSINCDAVRTNLCRCNDGNGIGGGCEFNSIDIVVRGYCCTLDFCEVGSPSRNVTRSYTGAVDNDLGHTGVSDNYCGALIEACGIGIITDVGRGPTFVICNGNAILHPNLCRGVVLGTICQISKADGCFC